MQHPGVAAAARTGGTYVGKAIEERPQPHLAFGTRQSRAQAEMPTAGEGQMFAGIVTFDVERIGIGKDRRITVGRGDVDDDQLALTYRMARNLGVAQRYSCRELDWGLQAAGSPRRRSATARAAG